MEHPRNVRFDGEFGRRIELTLKRLHGSPFDLDLLAQDVRRDPQLTRRFEEYEGDVSGRTLGVLSYHALLTGKRSSRADSLFERILAAQKPEGYFGLDQKQLGWDEWGRQIFGHGRLLAGLVMYYRSSGDPRALQAAEKLADYLTADIPLWRTLYADNPWSDLSPLIKWTNEASNRRHFIKTHMTSILEGLMMLQMISPKTERLDAAHQILAHFPEFGQYHSHSYLNTLVGAAMLCDLTDDRQLEKRLTSLYWGKILRHGVPSDGGICEFFPDDLRTEGCSVADWIRLNLFLWQITHRTVYLDQAENAWLNALDFHQTGNGAFGHAERTPNGYAAEYTEAWWCCTMHGLWAFIDLANFAAVVKEDTVWINFYAPMEFDLKLKGASSHLRLETNYPQNGNISLRLGVGNPTQFSLCLRIPEWAREWQIRVNGKPIKAEQADGYIVITRTWQKNDSVTLEMPFALRLIDERGNNLLESRELREPYRVSFFYGPLLLAADSQRNSRLPSLVTYEKGKNYQLKDTAAPFLRAKAHFMLPAVIDRLAPGIDGFVSTVFLTPLSEQTALDEWSDEWRNFMRNGEKPIRRHEVMIRMPVVIR
ncbi:MAG: glycoside hydrolase family 127 protein [candidate division KSB1 bacterium]|nr:glycoside hydrolase family 127 protein [candidate division KSB1 bacterium]